MIRIRRKCKCCEQRTLIIIRNTVACLECDRAANWKGVSDK